MITVMQAQPADHDYLVQHERHIEAKTVARKLKAGKFLLVKRDDAPFGWLRWGYFWDEIPFMNMLYLAEAERGQGYGRRLVTVWEEQMRAMDYAQVMTSTLSNEPAQHFYRKLGYVDCGALLLPGEALEILFRKALTEA